jgi:hypothetical protein
MKRLLNFETLKLLEHAVGNFIYVYDRLISDPNLLQQSALRKVNP